MSAKRRFTCSVCKAPTRPRTHLCPECAGVSRRIAAVPGRAVNGGLRPPPGHADRVERYTRRAALSLPLFDRRA